MKIGLTGGIGCGKSSALAFFREAGAHTLETDAIVRDLLATDTELIEEVKGAFGAAILDSEGRVDRAALGRRVFSDSKALALLESLVHPRVRQHWMRALREKHEVLVVEIPLLFEKDLQDHFSLTICVSSNPDVQSDRLKAKGMTEKQIQYRKQHQLGLDEKMARASIVLFNNGKLAHLQEQVDWVMQELSKQPPTF